MYVNYDYRTVKAENGPRIIYNKASRLNHLSISHWATAPGIIIFSTLEGDLLTKLFICPSPKISRLIIILFIRFWCARTKTSITPFRTPTNSWKWWNYILLRSYDTSSFSKPPQSLYGPALILENDEFIFYFNHMLILHFQNLHQPYTNLRSFLKMMNLYFT